MIKEIKEKIKKNPKYVHPCNKEFQEYIKRYGFENGYKFICWMQQVGIMNNPVNIGRKLTQEKIKNAGCKTEKEYKDKKSQELGFKNNSDRIKEWKHYTVPPLSEYNKDCSSYFGDFTENLVIQTFECTIKMPPNNPGFDWICKKGDNVDNKCRCLDYSNKSPTWKFPIRYNNIAVWFILSAWDNRDGLNPFHVWVFHKNDIVRGRKFWRRETFSITNTPKALKELEKWEVTDRLDKLKEYCERLRKDV